MLDIISGLIKYIFHFGSLKYKLKVIIYKDLNKGIDNLDYELFRDGIYRLRVYDYKNGSDKYIQFKRQWKFSDDITEKEGIVEFYMKFDYNYLNKKKTEEKWKQEMVKQVLYEISVSRNQSFLNIEL